MTVIRHLTKRHASLRSTFHPPTGADGSTDSYVAVHEADTSLPNIEFVFEEKRLKQTIRQSFNLSEEFPIRWVILQKDLNSANTSTFSTTLFVVGHHIAVDGVSPTHETRMWLLINWTRLV